MSRKTNRQQEKRVRKAGGIRKPRGLGLHVTVCRLDHEDLRYAALSAIHDEGAEPPVDCPECGECLVVR